MSRMMVHASLQPGLARQVAPGVRASIEPRSTEEHRAPSAPRTAAHETRFRALVDAHLDAIWRTLRGLGVPEALADDAAQHVLLVALHKLASIEPGRERAFVLGTAVGVAANMRRSAARSREVADPDALLAHLDEAPDPEEQAVLCERRQLVERVLESMPEELRTVFVLFELEGLTSIEIGEALDIPTGTATSRLRRAREHFQVRAARWTADPTTRRSDA